MLSTEQQKQLISLAGIRVRPTMRVVTFYDEPIGITGFDLIEDGEVVATYAKVKGETRALYPEGGEYTHTSYSDLPCTYDAILQVASRRALRVLENKLTVR